MNAFGLFSCRFAKKKNSELKRKFQLFGDKFLFWHILVVAVSTKTFLHTTRRKYYDSDGTNSDK